MLSVLPLFVFIFLLILIFLLLTTSHHLAVMRRGGVNKTLSWLEVEVNSSTIKLQSKSY